MAAKACRIDDIVFLPANDPHAPNGVQVKYTEGPDPLPATWQGMSEVWFSVADYQEYVRSIEDA